MKNLKIRVKMIALYVVITSFTMILFFAAYAIMRGLVGQEPQQAAKTIRGFAIAFPIFCAVYVGVVFKVARIIAKQVAYPAAALVQAAKKIATGEVDVLLEHNTQDEMGELTSSFKEMLVASQSQAEILQTIAQGDYTQTAQQRGGGDVVMGAIAQMLENNNNLISAIRMAAQQVSGGAQQVAHSAQILSAGSIKQAASVQEFSASLTAVMQQSMDNAKASQKALEVTSASGQKMDESIQYMVQVSQAMHEIDTSSQEITKVIKAIEDIAFQTNILALNAAVEAARAGAHGKGFAVVADEVRNLAAKSAEAAKETTALIEGSRHRVQEGSQVVEKTNTALNELGGLAAQTLELVSGISKESEQQSQAVSEISGGIEQISAVVQSNSATAEQSAAAAEEMSAQAELLTRAVAHFRLRGDAAQNRALPAQGAYVQDTAYAQGAYTPQALAAPTGQEIF